MKTAKVVTRKNGKTPNRLAGLNPTAADYLDKFKREGDAREFASMAEIAKIKCAWNFSTPDSEVGIGYKDGKLVEFAASRSSDFRSNEITIADSLEWLANMHFVECRMEMQTDWDGDAREEWITDVRWAVCDDGVITRMERLK